MTGLEPLTAQRLLEAIAERRRLDLPSNVLHCSSKALGELEKSLQRIAEYAVTEAASSVFGVRVELDPSLLEGWELVDDVPDPSCG